MRALIASGMLGLLVLPAAAAEKKAPDTKEVRLALTDSDATPRALMDSTESSNDDFSALLNDGTLRKTVEPQSDGSPAEGAPKAETAPGAPATRTVVYRPMSQVCEAVKQSARSNNLPETFLIRLLHQESGFRPDIVSHAGAQGVAQFMPETASSVGLENPFDPLQAIPASARLLRSLLAQFGNIGLAAAAYNAGPRRIQEWLAGKSKTAKLPEETQGYVRAITGKPIENWKSVSKLVPDNRTVIRAPCKPDSGDVMQVAEAPAPQPKGKLAKLAAGVKGALQRVAGVKSRMALKARPSLTIVRKDNARILVAEGARGKSKGNAMLAKRATKGKPVRMARAG